MKEKSENIEDENHRIRTPWCVLKKPPLYGMFEVKYCFCSVDTFFGHERFEMSDQRQRD